MNKHFEIHVYLDVSKDFNYRIFDRMANIVFSAGKHSSGLIMSDNCVHRIYGWGKHSDAVRVYSALKNNEYEVIYCEGV